MLRNAVWPAGLAAGVIVALGGAAEGAIRVTLSDGGETAVFYSPSSQAAVINTSLGNFEIVLHTSLSNYPGAGTGGELLQTLTLSDTTPANAGLLPTLTVTAEIIQAVGALGAGQVSGADLGDVLISPLLRFTQPDDSLLQVSSSISSPTLAESAMLQNNTTVNSVLVSAATGLGDSATSLGVAANTSLGYTLTSQLVISGANVGTDLSLSAASSAASSATPAAPAAIHAPEPSTMLVFAVGGLGLALALCWRRLRHYLA